jgi:hypothetical protein
MQHAAVVLYADCTRAPSTVLCVRQCTCKLKYSASRDVQQFYVQALRYLISIRVITDQQLTGCTVIVQSI